MKRSILFTAISLVLALPAPAVLMADESLEGKALYLQCNVWFKNPLKISSVNYHSGSILWAGTRVRISKISGRGIDFVTEENGLKYRMLFSRKHFPGLDPMGLAKLYFGPDNPLGGAAYAGFSDIEKRGINEGSVFEGMSKAAVLMAYGYPPAHRTRSIDMDLWNYWNNRLFRMEVLFGKDGRVLLVTGRGS